MQLFDIIAEKMPLFVPIHDNGGVSFTPWKPGETPAATVAWESMDNAAFNTTLSPKGFFLPMMEHLYSSHFTQAAHGSTWQITPADTTDRPFALFGVRACDMAGLDLLDKVFLTEPIDVMFQARRKAAHIITLPCRNRCATCFCDAFGIDPTQPGGDVTLYPGTDIRWEAHTPKGKSLTTSWTHELLRASTNQFAQASLPYGESIIERHGSHTSHDVHFNDNHFAKTAASIMTEFETQFFGGTSPLITSTDATALFNSPAWDTLHHTCIACGTCAFLCPTCQCYDIHTQSTHCHRHWDTCLNASFTQMAHGNPRPTKKERFRQRFMHKLVYFRQRFGVSTECHKLQALADIRFSCVGCGRCVKFCPAGINPLDIAHALCATHVATSQSEDAHV